MLFNYFIVRLSILEKAREVTNFFLDIQFWRGVPGL